METRHLTYFKVENFKRFDSLEVQDIGQFNLIVGDNNVGKTSLLEALLFDENSSQFLYNIRNSLGLRKINMPDKDLINYLDFFLYDKNKTLSFHYCCLNNNLKNRLSISKKDFNSLTTEDIRKLESSFMVRQVQYLIEFDVNDKHEIKFLTYGDTFGIHNKYLPFISFNSTYDNDLLDFFSKLSIQTNKLENIQNEIKYFLPNLLSIEINTAIIPHTSTLAIREKEADLELLTQYGEGLIKLLRYLLTIDVFQNARLMIDEIDTGIHYSRMKEFLKRVIQTAKDKKVQIFATTHSKECLEYYKQALEELSLQDSGRIIRIADTKSGIKSFTLNYAQFDNALMAESEIR